MSDNNNPHNTSMDLIYIMVVLIIFGVILFNNFANVMQFRWYYDLYKINDSICSHGNVSQLEIETTRYNIFRFFNSLSSEKSKFASILSDFEMSRNIMLIFFTILIVYLFILCYINKYSYSSALALPMSLFLFYIIVSSVITADFSKISKEILDPICNVNVYKNTYLILNAIMLLSGIQNDKVEFYHDNFNTYDRTLDDIIESNISSYENISNTSKINQAKITSYDRLDFVKYLTLNRLSNYHLKYFDNIYIRIPDRKHQLNDMDENIYLKDIVDKRVDFEKIRANFEKISNSLSVLLENELDAQYNRDTVSAIKEHIDTNYPIFAQDSDSMGMHKSIVLFYYNMPFFTENISKNYYYGKKFNIPDNAKKNVLKTMKLNSIYDITNTIVPLLNEIEFMLENSSYDNLYIRLNKKIEEKVGIYVDVPNNDFIYYLIENQDILFSENFETQFRDIIGSMKHHCDLSFLYIAFIVFVGIVMMHLIYINITNKYVYLSSVIVFLIVYAILLSVVKYI